jgi:amino acid permease
MHTPDVAGTGASSHLESGLGHGDGDGDADADADDVTDERAQLLPRQLPESGMQRGTSDDGSSWEGSRRSFWEAVIVPAADMMPSFDEGSIRGSVFNLSSATLGAGALSVPFAFKSMGIGLGLALIIICGVATAFSIKLLILTRARTNLSSFEQVTERLFGSTAAASVEASIAIFCFGSGVAYCKSIRDFLLPIIQLYHIDSMLPGYDVEKCAMGLVWVCLLLPLSLIRDINKLRYCSLLGVVTIMYLAIAIAQHSIHNFEPSRFRPPWEGYDLWVSLNLLDIISALPIFLFAFTCQINVFAIFDGLARASSPRMNKVTFRAVVLCFAIYSCIGLFGFIEFGDDTCGNILKNYASEFTDGNLVAVTMYASVAVTIILSFPLVVQPCRAATEALMLRFLPPCDRHFSTTLVISGGCLAVSLFVPHINEVFQLLGGTVSSFVCYVLPALFAIRLQVFIDRPIALFFAYLLALAGGLAGILSTCLTIYGFLHPQLGPEQCN